MDPVDYLIPLLAILYIGADIYVARRRRQRMLKVKP